MVYRLGQYLWQEWDGENFDPELDDPAIYFVREHVNLDNDTIRRALAYAIQRDGITDSPAHALRLLEHSKARTGWAYRLPQDREYTWHEFAFLDELDVEDPVAFEEDTPVTLVEFEIDD